jgi:hypothetical protein
MHRKVCAAVDSNSLLNSKGRRVVEYLNIFKCHIFRLFRKRWEHCGMNYAISTPGIASLDEIREQHEYDPPLDLRVILLS